MSAAEPPLLVEPPEPTSIGAKLFNIIATPGDVFEELRFSPPRALNWIVPVLLLVAVNCVFVWNAFRNPAVVHSIREQQSVQMRKKFAAQPGMTEEKIEKAVEKTREFMTPKIMTIMGMAGATVGAFVVLFGQGFVLWAADRLLSRTGTDFIRFVEICGVAETISVLGVVVRIFIAQATGNMQMGASVALMMGGFDPSNALHLALNNVEFFFLWHLGVVALGVQVVTRAPLVRAVVGVAVFWVLLTGVVCLAAL